MAYSKKISATKSASGAIDGAIASIAAAVVIAFVKQNIDSMTPETENAVAASVGVIVSAAIVAVKRFVGNWMKHRDKAQAQPQQ